MTSPVRIPADVDMADRVIGPLTARQVTILGLAGLALYAAWDATRPFVPAAVFLALAVPVAVTAVILALGRRDGVSMDRLLLAAIRHRATPRTRVAPPTDPDGQAGTPGWLDARRLPDETETRRRRGQLRLPATSVTGSSANGGATGSGTDSSGTDVGVVDLGADGLAVVAVVSTVNFALRTPDEQQALVATFGRYLHSLAAPVQVLVRAERLDLTGQVDDLRGGAEDLPHPALRAAALEHADYLTRLADHSILLRRQVLLVLREPVAATAPVDGLGGPSAASVLASLLRPRARTAGMRASGNPTRRAAEARLTRRLAEAVELLAPAGITVTPLDAARTAAVLAAACNPDALLPATPRRAGPDDVISGAASGPADDLSVTPERPDALLNPTNRWEGDPDEEWDDPEWDYDDADPDDTEPDDGDDYGYQKALNGGARRRSPARMWGGRR